MRSLTRSRPLASSKERMWPPLTPWIAAKTKNRRLNFNLNRSAKGIISKIRNRVVKKIFFGNSKKCSLEILANGVKIEKKST